MVFATCKGTQQSSKKWLPCLISNLDFCFQALFFASPGEPVFVDLLSEHSLTHSGSPAAHWFHAWESQLPAGLPTLSAGPNQEAQCQTQAMLKEALGREGRRRWEGCSCSYPFDRDLHLSDGCWHLGKEQGLRVGGVGDPSTAPPLSASFNPWVGTTHPPARVSASPAY